jgi:NADPH:quinone reductase-like Zn-dependent oxidoreductase
VAGLISAWTTLRGLRIQGQVWPGQKILIIGAVGGAGTFAVQLAGLFGAQVTGVCGTAKTDQVRSVGAEDIIDYIRDDFADRGIRLTCRLGRLSLSVPGPKVGM